MQETGLWGVTALDIFHWPKHKKMVAEIHFTGDTGRMAQTPTLSPGCPHVL